MTDKILLEILIGMAFLYVFYNGIGLYTMLMGRKSGDISAKYETMFSALLLKRNVDPAVRKKVIGVYVGVLAIATINFVLAGMQAAP